MSAKSFTPGPWSLSTVATSSGSCHKIGPFPSAGRRPEVHACVYADGIRIGIDDDLPVAKELLANATLMAGAPDLLAALEAAVECGMVPISTSKEVGACKYSQQVEVADQIRSAIAKARGETA